MKRAGVILFFGFLLVACILRLPLILSEHFVLDGDEAIIGLMAFDAVQNGDWWPLFWGQNYGFVLPEILTIFPFISLFGLSAFAVKTPLLLWFVMGVFFIHKSIAYYTNGHQKWLLTFLLLAAPTWLLWSMRLRGGYLPAFAIAHYLIYLSLSNDWKPWFFWLWRGILTGCVFVLQAIWFPGTLFFLAFSWWRTGKSLFSLIAFTAGLFFPWAALSMFFVEQPYHQPSFFIFDLEVVSFNASVYLSYLERAMQGLYLHGKAFREIIAANVFSLSFLALAAATVVAGARAWLFKSGTLFIIPALFALASLLFWSFFLGSAAPRYALPLFGYVLLLLPMVWADKSSGWLKAVLLLLSMLSVVVSMNASKIRYEDFSQKQMNHLISNLQSRHISVVFTDNYMLQWQIMFYSGHEILACTQQKVDRIPWRIDAARKVYFDHPEKTALVQLVDDAPKDQISNNGFLITPSPKLKDWFIQ
jgi:hypothetical protein